VCGDARLKRQDHSRQKVRGEENEAGKIGGEVVPVFREKVRQRETIHFNPAGILQKDGREENFDEKNRIGLPAIHAAGAGSGTL
jgi:hypothetical protein